MSDYTKTVDFAAKDNLLTGNPLKLIKGTEINTEFTNIATAVATKVNGIAASVDGEIALFDSTTGKLLKRASSTGILKAASGVLSAATAGTDYGKPDTASSWTAQQTFKELKETVYTITDGAAFEIDPANGSVQKIVLGASRTPKATNFESGQSVMLKISDGTAYTITWTDGTLSPVWVGGSAPTLATSGYTHVMLWKDGDAMYGKHAGDTT